MSVADVMLRDVAAKYRRRRVHLKAHDRGDNRHDKGVRWMRVGRRKGKVYGAAGQPGKHEGDGTGLVGCRPSKVSLDAAHIYDVVPKERGA